MISREGRRFRERVLAILAAKGVRPLFGRLAVHVDVFPPDNRRRDLDNCLKSLLDALEKGGAYRDDNQIAELSAKRLGMSCPGKVIVRVEEIKDVP